jgi:hypothetical protein
MRLYAQSIIDPNDPDTNARLYEGRYWHIAARRPDLAHDIYDMRRGVTSALLDGQTMASTDPTVNILQTAQIFDTGTLQHRTATPYEIGRMIAFNAALVYSSTQTTTRQ